MTREELADDSKASSRRISRRGSWTTRGQQGAAQEASERCPSTSLRWVSTPCSSPRTMSSGRGRHSSAGSTAGLPSALLRGRPRAGISGCPHLGEAHFLSSLYNQHREPFLHTSWDSASWCLLLEEWWGELLLNALVNSQNSLCPREWDELKTEELHCYCVPDFLRLMGTEMLQRKEHPSIPPALPLSSLM